MIGTSINDLKSYFSQTDTQLGSLKPVSNKDDANSFSKAMAEAQGKPVNTGTDQGFQGVEKNAQGRTEVTGSSRKDLTEKVDKTDKVSDKTDDVNATDKFAEKLDKIKKAIKDELGITDEQLNAAMEALHMTQGELLNPDSVKQLMMDISGTENAIDLLTNEDLLAGINTVIGLVNESVDSLKEELSLDDEAFAKLAAQIDEALSLQNEGEEMQPVLNEMPKEVSEVSEERPREQEKTFAVADNTRSQKTEETSEKAETAEASNATSSNTAANVSKKSDLNDHSEKNEDAREELMQAPQTIVQTEVNEAGEVVQTVRSYSSYAENAEIVNQVTEQIKVNISSDSTSMEMMLHPASLGAVNIQVTQQGNILHAQILVQNEQVKDAIAGQMEQLLKTFEEQGQKVTEIDVSVANYNLEHGLDQNQNGQNGTGNGNGESAGSRRLRRTLDLNALSDDDIAELSDDDRLQAEVMSMSGTSVEYRA